MMILEATLSTASFTVNRSCTARLPVDLTFLVESVGRLARVEAANESFETFVIFPYLPLTI